MRAKLHLHSLSIKRYIFPFIISFGLLSTSIINAEIINIPLHRSIATQPITSLEIIAIVKSLLSGRVLSIKKLSSYNNPDCHQVKLLEDKGEFQIIRLGCYTDSLVQAKQQKS